MASKASAPGATLERLRSLVGDSLGKHMYANAVFFADKLVSISGGHADDVYRLAQAYFYTKQYRRAVHVLRAYSISQSSVRCCYLSAKCLLESRDYDEALALVARGLDLVQEEEGSSARAHGAEGRLSSAACLHLVAARAHTAQDCLSLAARQYVLAVQADVFCVEAIDALLAHRMLASEQQALLLQELLRRVPSSDAWLACYYRCKLDQSFALELSDTVGAVGASGGGVAVTVARQPHPYAAHVHPSSTEGAAPALGVGGGVGGGSAAPDPAPRARPSASAQRTHTETFGLEHNSDVLSSIAESHYDVGDYVAAYAISSRVLQADPYELACVPVHCCTLLQLRRKPELFALAHKLVEGYPQRAESWFAVGVYYHLIGEHENARRYFSKATSLQHHFVPAWVGFAHAFAAQDESDQAMVAYRTATRLFAGCPLPWLGIGVEYLRTNHHALAEQYIRQAHALAPEHPLVLHELGVVHYCKGEYEDACAAFGAVAHAAGHRAPAAAAEAREPSLCNLGHSYRKLGRYAEAVRCYEDALAISPHAPATYAALGFACQLMGDLHAAIVHYHQALALRPDDTFTAEMLTRALEEALDGDPYELGPGTGSAHFAPPVPPAGRAGLSGAASGRATRAAAGSGARVPRTRASVADVRDDDTDELPDMEVTAT